MNKCLNKSYNLSWMWTKVPGNHLSAVKATGFSVTTSVKERKRKNKLALGTMCAKMAVNTLTRWWSYIGQVSGSQDINFHHLETVGVCAQICCSCTANLLQCFIIAVLIFHFQVVDRGVDTWASTVAWLEIFWPLSSWQCHNKQKAVSSQITDKRTQ